MPAFYYLLPSIRTILSPRNHRRSVHVVSHSQLLDDTVLVPLTDRTVDGRPSSQNCRFRLSSFPSLSYVFLFFCATPTHTRRNGPSSKWSHSLSCRKLKMKQVCSNGMSLSKDQPIRRTRVVFFVCIWNSHKNIPSNHQNLLSKRKCTIPVSNWKQDWSVKRFWDNGVQRAMSTIVWRPYMHSSKIPVRTIPLKMTLRNNLLPNRKNLKKWPKSTPKTTPSSRQGWEADFLSSLIRSSSLPTGFPRFLSFGPVPPVVSLFLLEGGRHGPSVLLPLLSFLSLWLQRRAAYVLITRT